MHHPTGKLSRNSRRKQKGSLTEATLTYQQQPRKETNRQDKVSKTAPCVTKRGSYRHWRFILESVQEEGCIDDNYTVIPTHEHYKVPKYWTLEMELLSSSWQRGFV
jgi:hypothetical protein